jgi:ketosteroid isomerase-like protein
MARRHPAGTTTLCHCLPVPHPREEIEAAVARYLEVRERMDRGEGGWTDMAGLFTDDATYIDPAWGRVDGIEAITDFLERSMAGLEDWVFPVEWVAIDGDHVVVKWIQRLPGRRPDGTHYDNSGVSLLTYAGDGRFSRSEDHLNMLHVYEVIAESGWRPGPGFTAPPDHPPRL